MLHYLERSFKNPSTRHAPFHEHPPLRLRPKPQTRRTTATRTTIRRAEVAHGSVVSGLYFSWNWSSSCRACYEGYVDLVVSALSCRVKDSRQVEVRARRGFRPMELSAGGMYANSVSSGSRLRLTPACTPKYVRVVSSPLPQKRHGGLN